MGSCCGCCRDPDSDEAVNVDELFRGVWSAHGPEESAAVLDVLAVLDVPVSSQ